MRNLLYQDRRGFSEKEIELIEKGFRNLEKRGIRLLIDPKDMSVRCFQTKSRSCSDWQKRSG